MARCRLRVLVLALAVCAAAGAANETALAKNETAIDKPASNSSLIDEDGRDVVTTSDGKGIVLPTAVAAINSTGRDNSTMEGLSTCSPDPFGLSQCNEQQYCCPLFNTCVDKSSCEELAKNCPQNACGDAAFADVACPAFTNQYGFKIGSQIKCMASTDTWCFSNGTSMVLACKSETGSGAAGVSTSLPVLAVVALASLLVQRLL